MKNAFLLFIVLVLVRNQAQAGIDMTMFEMNGEALLGADLHSKPSAREGQLEFLVRKLEAELNMDLDERAQFDLKLRGAEERDQTAKTHKFALLLEQAEVSFFTKYGTFSTGLVTHPWQEAQKDFLEFELWGDSSQSMATRYKYVGKSDLGLVWRWDFNNGGQTQIGLLNGEENRSEEKGTKKDITFVWDQPLGPALLGLGITYGVYDLYSPVNDKNRVQLRGKVPWGRSQFGFELLRAEDSADAATEYGLAEGVELNTELPGLKATATGGSFWWLYQLSDQEKVLLRANDLNPAQEVAEKSIRSLQLAGALQYSEAVLFCAFYEVTERQSKHSTVSPSDERVGISTQIIF